MAAKYHKKALELEKFWFFYLFFDRYFDSFSKKIIEENAMGDEWIGVKYE